MADQLEDLIDRCLAGDEQALAELVGQFRGVVFGLCYRMVGHVHDAEDLTQETFVRAIRSLHRYDRQRAFRPWLMTIAVNRCRSLLGTRVRHQVLRALPENLADDAPNEAPARQLAQELELALAGLRDEYRRAFLLLHEQHLSYGEIGRALGCPEGTAKTWVHRARRELAIALRNRGALPE